MEPDRRGLDPQMTELRPLLAASPPPAADSPPPVADSPPPVADSPPPVADSPPPSPAISPPPSPTGSPTPLRAAHLLYQTLVAEDVDRFSAVLSSCDDQPAAVNHFHGDGFTCLQYACMHELSEFVELLLKAGADPAVASPVSRRTPLHWAAASDAPCIISRLLEHTPSLDLSAEDVTGVTPLQLAAQSGGSAAVLALLRAGADISASTDTGRPLLHAVPADVLEEFLDGCVHNDGRYVTDRDCCLRLDFSLMWPRRSAGSRPGFETAALYHLSTSRAHRHLLCHPLVESFVDLKWWQVRFYFLADLLYYLLFLALLTSLVVLRAESAETPPPRRHHDLWAATLAVMIPLAVVKVMHLVATPTRCVLGDRNGLLKFPLLVMTGVYLGLKLERGPQLQLSAVLMLFAWVELFALLSRIPAVSIYASMLQMVIWRFVSFVILYLALILGLTLSTYIMLKECRDGQRHLAVGFLRSFVMTMDKVDLKSLPIDSHASLARLLFIVLFFIMTVTLTNLVNSLAVTDITIMRKHARIFSLARRVHLLAYTESMMLDEPCEFLGQRRCLYPGCASRRRDARTSQKPLRLPAPFYWVRRARAWLSRAVLLRQWLPERRLCLYPNRVGPAAALIPGPTFQTEPALPRSWRFSVERVAAARQLTLRQAQRTDLTSRMSRLESRLTGQLDHGP